MTRDHYLFQMKVRVLISEGTTPRAVEHDGIGEIIETKCGSLLLHDIHACPVAIYAAGRWIESAVVTRHAVS